MPTTTTSGARSHGHHRRRVRTQQKRLIRKWIIGAFWLCLAVVGVYSIITVMSMLSPG